MGKFSKLAVIGGALLLANGLDNRLEVTHYQVKQKSLPKEFDGFRIVHISDFHCDTTPGLVNEIRGEFPDIIVITGDLAHDTGSFDAFIHLLEQLLKIAPCYMVSGNHDVWRTDYKDLVAACRARGGIFLQDERVELERSGAKIAISGIEDPFTRDKDLMAKKLAQSLNTLGPYDGYELLLFHRASSLDRLKDQGFDLILAGHMHGGQFRIPGVGGVLAPRSSLSENSKMFFPKYFGGRYENGGTVMIVNRGIGNPMVIPRFFNRPEIGSIVLEHEA